ncbi:pentose kinase [Mesorhizobium sanjuanii]|uniref:Pentose kinase n=1 Tax=Mesorhizobium sanjuanii TaxID=2037900 RepID=A0A2A6FMX1_9HYPH|nr:FGGY family carbohydrate kinase [Mesorhizobium sanjuanii]PDQ23085.1 pentose kinase [Mesorhizobium sanjuanii]
MSVSVMAFDLGTGGVKAAVFRSDGVCIAECIVPYQTFYPSPSRHEQRPLDWWDSVLKSLRTLLAEPAVDAQSVRAIAISGHSLGCVPLSDAGELLQEFTPIWSDGRAEQEAEAFFSKTDRLGWYRRTGNGFPASLYTLFKVLWLRRHEPDVFARTRTIIGTKDFINYRLTGRILTDHSYASGTGAYDLQAGRYCEELLAAAELDVGLFPDIVASTDVVGEVLPDVAAMLGLLRGVVVVAGGVDNSCMALGACTFAEGDAFSSMGSSSWLTVSSSQPLLDDRVWPYVFAHVVPGMFISATSIFSSGTSLNWVRDNLLPDIAERAAAAGRDVFDELFQMALASPRGAHGLVFLPALGGGTAFEGGPAVRGGFVGLDLRHDRADVMRATLEGIALGLRVALDELRRMTSVRAEMIMVGGGARSAIWRRIFADVFGCTILKTGIHQQATALGAAALALVGIGAWPDFQHIRALHVAENRTDPDPEAVSVYDAALNAYRLAAGQQLALSGPLSALRDLSS